MTWFKVDDGFPSHPKARTAGTAGRGLWLAAGAACASRNTDGLVEPLVAKDAAYLAEVDLETASASLVAAGLWHDAKGLRRCERCKAAAGRLEPGAFYFHDWLEYQPTKDEAKLPEHRLKWRRAKALGRNTDLREAIVQRDRSRCRYCTVRVDFRDRVGPTGGTYDHVDPDGVNTFENVVVACRRCNGVKGNRTPEEAGMPLVATPSPDLAGASSGPSLGQPPAEPELALASASRARPERAGSGQVGARPGPSRDQAPARSGRAPASARSVPGPVSSPSATGSGASS